MKIYNTFSAKKEVFQSLQPGKIGMYLCGPTVYDSGHVGHGRAAVSFDIIRRYFLYKGYDVIFVTNYTDIEDKMIQRAEKLGISVPELAERIIPEYERDYHALGVRGGTFQPRATDSIAEMILLIQTLEQKGHTYVLDDGVYFDVSTFKDYGRLSKQILDELRSGVRVAVKEKKRHPQDFVLWKFFKQGEPFWDSPWGKGRPGWHIECSAMARRYLGETFDIHCGGADLIFPHHECEIAQSEACSGKKFVKYWLHNGFICINKEKMSKSLGNFFTLKEIFQTYNPQALRLLFLQTHYRSPIEFSEDLVKQSVNSLERIHDFMRRLEQYLPPENVHFPFEQEIIDLLDETQKIFEQAMEDDFETPKALAACFDFIRDVHRFLDSKNLTFALRSRILAFIYQIDQVLGIFIPTQKMPIDHDIQALIEKRNQARQEKNFRMADEIRDQLLAQGIQLEDSPNGTLWKKVQ